MPSHGRHLVVVGSSPVLHADLVVVVDGDVDVANVKVEGGDEVDACNGGDFEKDLRGLPCVVDEWRSTMTISTFEMKTPCFDLLGAHASDHVADKR